MQSGFSDKNIQKSFKLSQILITFDLMFRNIATYNSRFQNNGENESIQGQRITSKIGSGFANAPLDPLDDRLSQVTDSPYGNDYEKFGSVLRDMMQRNFECAGFIEGEVIFDPQLETIHEYTDANGEEND
ncbi:MAG: hypothetical protein ACQESM_08970, partial [Bacteroidota bacterium]